MREFWNAVGLIALAIIVILGVANWDKLKVLLGISKPLGALTSTEATSTTSSDGTNTSTGAVILDGTPCVNISGQSGVIQNGQCVVVQPPSIYNVKVTNTNGARVHQYYNAYGSQPAQFVPQNRWIAVNTVLPYTQTIQAQIAKWYRTQEGWVSSLDVQTV